MNGSSSFTPRCGLPTLVWVAAWSLLASMLPNSAYSAEPSGLTTRELPPLKTPVTSFGAAVAEGHLYVYGGQVGGAHEYSIDSQTGQFIRLDLAKPTAWETLKEAPRRTGLAMVSYAGKVYRIGGWEAKNAKGEKARLFSTPDFSRFDPKTGKWQDLAPLPAGRSSHDAALLGSKVYVVGGWELAGEGDGTWHDSALVCDLAEAEPKWQAIAKPPFTRRALAVAAWQDKVYVIGGMNDSNETTTAASVYDPKANRWAEGPALPGQGFDGFGMSAFRAESGLYATLATGKLYRLSADGKSWQEVGALAHARTFHRLVSDEAGGLLIVGGTSRPRGKVPEVEQIAFPAAGESR